MKITIGELMKKIDEISKAVEELESTNSPSTYTLEHAAEYLDDYVAMLKDAKVDI